MLVRTNLSDVLAFFFSGCAIVSVRDRFLVTHVELWLPPRRSDPCKSQCWYRTSKEEQDPLRMSLVPRVRSGVFLNISCNIGWRKLSIQFLSLHSNSPAINKCWWKAGGSPPFPPPSLLYGYGYLILSLLYWNPGCISSLVWLLQRKVVESLS